MSEGPLNGYSRIATFATVGIAIFGGIYWVGSIANRVATMEVQTASFGKVAYDFTAFRARNCQELAKIETQFGTVEEVMNDVHVNDLRRFDKIEFKLFSEPPSGVYHEIRIPHEIEPCE